MAGLVTSMILNCAYDGLLISFLFVQVDEVTSVSGLLNNGFTFRVADDALVHKILSVMLQIGKWKREHFNFDDDCF